MRVPICWIASAAMAASAGSSRPDSAQCTSSAIPPTVMPVDHAVATSDRRVRRRASLRSCTMRSS
jgi:hypothetical protein